MSSDGVVTKASPLGVDETVRRLLSVLEAHDVTVFAIVDHSGAAEAVGLTMPNTKLVIFGNPKAGTPVMLAEPLAALDLPLKLLIREDAEGVTQVSYNAPEFLIRRHHLDDKFEPPLAAIELIATETVAGDH
jgi:uncharacterized protein (DUF302 family)